MRKTRTLMLAAVIFAVMAVFTITAQAADTMVDLTAKIDGDRFWTSLYTTAYGDEDVITLYKLKSVIVEIKSGNTVIDSFIFTAAGSQSHRFLLTTPHQNIQVQYRAITYTDRQFSFGFDYKPGGTLAISNNASQIVAKTPFFTYR